MILDRTKNAIRNIIWGVIERIVVLLLPFITRTVLIRILGAEYLGLNSLFASILQVLSVSELGFGSAIVFSMYKPIAEDDNKTLCALLNVYRKIYNLVGTFILVAGLLLLPFLPHLIKGSYPEDVNLYILYLLFLANTVISFFLYAYKTSLFSAFQRNDLQSKRTTLVSIGSNVLQIIFLLSLKNYYIYVLVIPLATIITNLANAYIASKNYPNIVPVGTISQELKEGIKKRIIGLLSYKINGVAASALDSVFISIFLGLTSLAIYNNYYSILFAILSIMVILTNSITAGIGNKMITNSPDINYRDFKVLVFINSWITGVLAVIMLCIYQDLMQLWMGKSLMFPVDTMGLMVLLFLLPRMTAVTFIYREAAGLWYEDRYRPWVATIVKIVTAIYLLQKIGMNGAIISTLICTIFIQIPWGSYILFKYYFKRSPMEYFKQTFYYVTVSCVVGAMCYYLCNLISEVCIMDLLLKIVISFIFANIMFLIIMSKQYEFRYGLTFVLHRIKNKNTE